MKNNFILIQSPDRKFYQSYTSIDQSNLNRSIPYTGVELASTLTQTRPFTGKSRSFKASNSRYITQDSSETSKFQKPMRKINVSLENQRKNFSWQKNQFRRYFKTTANKMLNFRDEAYSRQRLRCFENSYDSPQRRPRVPSVDFTKQNGDRTVFITTYQPYTEHRFANYKEEFQPEKKIVPLEKLLFRKELKINKQSPDKFDEVSTRYYQQIKYDQSHINCYLNLGRNSRLLFVFYTQKIGPLTKIKKEKDPNIDLMKAVRTSLNLRQRTKSYNDFGTLVGRETLSPCQKRQRIKK